ncbi:MAG: hypothetical protein OXI60_11580 [Acidiferrobacterales bacterium]|nr:hypothetical protein [Acidiferrobacterales bacterium]
MSVCAGSGKNVLLNEIQEIAESENAITEYIEVSNTEPFLKSIVPALRSVLLILDNTGRVNGYVKSGLRVLKSFVETIKVRVEGVEISLDIDPQRGTADSGVLARDLAELFLAVGEAAKCRNVSIVILIDEVQSLPSNEFEALVMAMHRTNQKNLPILVIGAGLPSLIKLAGNAGTYAERLFQYPEVGPLSSVDARRALVVPAQREDVEFENNAIDDVFSQTQGYPYFLQEWGYQVWNTAQGPVITLSDVKDSSILAAHRLDQNSFRSRYARTSDTQKNYLHAMAQCENRPYRTGLAEKILGKTSQQVSSTTEALISSGLIYSPSYGFTDFTVPLFDEFITRVHGAVNNEQIRGGPQRYVRVVHH